MTLPAPRPARPGDLDTIVDITNRAFSPYVPILGAPPLPMAEDYAPRIAAGEIWILEQVGKPVGLIVLERHSSHAEIFNIAVEPSAAGTGLGRLLLDFAVAKTREWRLPSLRLYTNAKMERNIAIYARYGFRETGRRPNPKRPGFIIVDMELAVR